MSYPSTNISGWNLALDSATTDTSALAGKAPTATKPTGDSYIGVTGKLQANSIVIQPLIDGSDNHTTNISVHLWRGVGTGVDRDYIAWLGAVVQATACTLEDDIGGTTYRLCDTITFTRGDPATHIISPGSNFAGMIVVDLYGAQYVQFGFDRGTADASNALYAFI